MALAACGPDEIASPGTGGNVIINNPTPAPTPTPTPTSGGTLVTPAGGCPTIADAQGLTDEGTISNSAGDEWRVCATPLRFNASSTLPQIDGLLYRLPGQVNVGTDGGPAADNSDGLTDTNVELTIEPGVIVYAAGSSFLNVTRGNSIDANGTEDRPIIFTSRDNIVGLNNANSSGQWGGVVLSGPRSCHRLLRGTRDPGHRRLRTPGGRRSPIPASLAAMMRTIHSGSLSYVQIRYSGFVLSGDNELQSLTTGGIGSGTTLNHIQSINSSDDGVEFFGGVVNISNLIVAGAEDDSLDTDTGCEGEHAVRPCSPARRDRRCHHRGGFQQRPGRPDAAPEHHRSATSPSSSAGWVTRLSASAAGPITASTTA